MGLSFIMVLAASVIKGITLLVSYIANNTFPLPLSEKEEQVYLQRLKGGDEDDIAKILGISRSYASRIEKHAINKLGKPFLV